MKNMLILLLLIISETCHTQEIYGDTIVDNKRFNYIKIDSADNSVFYGNMKNSILSGNSIHYKKIIVIDHYEQVKIIGSYKNGVKSGMWITTDLHGKVLFKGKYRKDLRVGKWCLFRGCEIYWYNRKGKAKRKAKGRCSGC